MAIVRGFSYRIGPAVTPAAVEKALAGLPIGDGIHLHRVVQILEDGHLVFVELHIGDPVTLERIELGRERVRQALAYGFVTTPRDTGLDGPGGRDAGMADELFEKEKAKIAGPSVGTSIADAIVSAFKGAGVIAVAVAVVVLVLAFRR